jgi:IS605 OrfB family transposase
LNAAKRAALLEQANRVGRIRSDVWREYGLKVVDPDKVKSVWVAKQRVASYGVLANPGKETLTDTLGNIKASRAASILPVKRAVWARYPKPSARSEVVDVHAEERKRLFTLLLQGREVEDPWLHRQVREHFVHGVNRCFNQINVRSDNYTTRIGANGKAWVSIPGLTRGKLVRIPLSTSRIPTGNLRVIVPVNGPVEVHYAVLAEKPCRPCGTQTLGVDKGYTEVFCDSDGDRYGLNLGAVLSAESEHRNAKGQARNRLRAASKLLAASQAQSDRDKAERIRLCNLGTKKADRRKRKFDATTRTIIRGAVHEVVDKSAVIFAEDLTKVIKGKPLSKGMNRKLAAWTKGEIASALKEISKRRGSSLQLVNAAFTSQVDPRHGTFGRRVSGRLYCFDGVVFDDDYAAARNVLARGTDKEITLYMKYTDVEKIIQARTEGFRSRLPDPDSYPNMRAKQPKTKRKSR